MVSFPQTADRMSQMKPGIEGYWKLFPNGAQEAALYHNSFDVLFVCFVFWLLVCFCLFLFITQQHRHYRFFKLHEL